MTLSYDKNKRCYLFIFLYIYVWFDHQPIVLLTHLLRFIKQIRIIIELCNWILQKLSHHYLKQSVHLLSLKPTALCKSRLVDLPFLLIYISLIRNLVLWINRLKRLTKINTLIVIINPSIILQTWGDTLIIINHQLNIACIICVIFFFIWISIFLL